MNNRFKVVFLGDTNVGKTSILIRFIKKTFDELYQSTIGCSFMIKDLILNGTTYRLDIWDTAGQERYRALLPMYYRSSNIVFICIDLTNNLSKSLEQIDYWLNELSKFKDIANQVIILVGTKSDIATTSNIEEYKINITKQYTHMYYVTSAKNDIGINNLFINAVKLTLNNESNNPTYNIQHEIFNTNWKNWFCNIL